MTPFRTSFSVYRDRKPPPPPKPPDTSFYARSENGNPPPNGDQQNSQPKLPETDFLTKSPTPNEIVSRAAVAEGVAGALIALPDGLLVAGRLPPESSGEALAGFLPQIFTKVSQSTNELRQGELNNLSFTVGGVPWKIFRVRALYFAAFGRAGEPLPTGELARLAHELDQRH